MFLLLLLPFSLFPPPSPLPPQGWLLFHQLLIDLFKFLAPFLRNAELTKPTQLLYKVRRTSHVDCLAHKTKEGGLAQNMSDCNSSFSYFFDTHVPFFYSPSSLSPPLPYPLSPSSLPLYFLTLSPHTLFLPLLYSPPPSIRFPPTHALLLSFRARYKCYLCCFMTSQSFSATTIFHSVMSSLQTASRCETSFSVPSHVTCDCPTPSHQTSR